MDEVFVRLQKNELEQRLNAFSRPQRTGMSFLGLFTRLVCLWIRVTVVPARHKHGVGTQNRFVRVVERDDDVHILVACDGIAGVRVEVERDG